MFRRRVIISVVATAYFGLIIGTAFLPFPSSRNSWWFWPFVTFLLVAFLLVFVLGSRRWWAALIFSGLGAAWVEAGQSVWMPAGYSSLYDLAWAGAGSILGVTMAVLIITSIRKSMRSHAPFRSVAQAGSREIPQD